MAARAYTGRSLRELPASRGFHPGDGSVIVSGEVGCCGANARSNSSLELLLVVGDSREGRDPPDLLAQMRVAGVRER